MKQNALQQRIQTTLEQLDQEHLRRSLKNVEELAGPEVVIEGKKKIQFCSNDYLGLANHPDLREAFIEGVRRYGVGATASRFIVGNTKDHTLLEEELAAGKGVERALLFSSGYAAAVASIPALTQKGDVILLDKLAHASLIDGARASEATWHTFRHNDLNHLEHQLQRCREKVAPGGMLLIITESVFSMDGDVAPLGEIVVLKERYGAFLWVDEAHALGVRMPLEKEQSDLSSHSWRLGGLVGELGLQEYVEVQMGTMGKALGVSGGYLAGSRQLIEFLFQRSRSQIYSTAAPPPIVVAARAAIRLLGGNEGKERHATLWRHLHRMHQGLQKILKEGQQNRSLEPLSAILPWMVGEASEAVRFSQELWENGYYVAAIRYPTVARGKARLRFTVTASHTVEQIEGVLDMLSNFSETIFHH